MNLLKSALIFVGILTVLGVSINAYVQGGELNSSESGSAVADTIKDRSVANNYRIKALPVPTNLDFAGEPVPLEDPDVYERMDRELLVNTYWQSNALLLIKRANKFFPIIEPVLEEDIDLDDI